MALSTEQGFALLLGWGTIVRGWVLAEQGQGEEGIAQMRQGLDAWRATGAEGMRTYFLALLAEANGKVGQSEDGLHVLTEALAVGEKNGERFYEAELYRLQGELTLQKAGARDWRRGTSSASPQAPSPTSQALRGAEQEAEGYFLKAIELARRQQAKSLELRAAMSLSRLWQRQGKHAAAHELLVEVYDWFTEGFDTADLQEAKALRNALGA
jgi:predicted ATPase